MNRNEDTVKNTRTVRKGRYTKKVTPITRAKRAIVRRYQWFKKLSKPKKILVVATPILLFLIVVPLATYAYYARDISNQERLMNRNNTGVVLTDRNGTTFYSVGRAERRELVQLKDMSPSLKDALIAAEDKDFYDHGGFSILSIMKAMYANVVTRDATGFGGSTLTQQLAKNTVLSDRQTFMRKYQELAISIAIEREYSKDEILMMYLNSVFFGENAFGIHDAALAYYDKSPKDLSLAESAMLIGLLPAPSAYSPISGNPEYAKERQTTVLTRMVNNGYITEEQKQQALAEELAYATAESKNDSIAPHFAAMVMDELYEKYGVEKVTRSGYQVRTTLDIDMQKQLNKSVADHMSYIEGRGGSNAGAVAIDPTSGDIRALVGSADWDNKDWGKVNMVTTKRQPGSSFKPIYYAEALAKGLITPATIFEDKPTDFGGYTPQNASRTFSGKISVRNALNRSLNIPSVMVMQKLGVAPTIETAQRMGIDLDDSIDYGLPLALGSAEASLLEMTNAYAAYANQGEQYAPTSIRSIKDKFSKTLFVTKDKATQVQTAEASYLISNILADNAARAPIFGNSLTVPGKTVAVKTGTTDNSRDAWTIGYTPQIAVGVWVGNNNNDTMLSGGSDMAGPIWRQTMTQLLAGTPNVSFAVPSGVVQRAACYSNGGLADRSGVGTYQEYFLSSALPTATCQAVPEKETPPKEAEKPKECPTGQTGVYPDCKEEVKECPEGQTGVYPDCEEAPVESCDEGQTGTPPNCRPAETPSPPIGPTLPPGRQ